jgi:hypothetical protein
MTFTFREDWPMVQRRYEAWWEGEPLESPMLRVTAPKMALGLEHPPSYSAALVKWFTDPKHVLPRLERTLAATHYAGDAFPWIDPMSQGLAAVQAAYLGASYTIDPQTLTGWTAPFFDDWASRPHFSVDPQNYWWQATQRLLEAGAERSGGALHHFHPRSAGRR